MPEETRPPGSKLDARALKGRFIGFNEGEKGWVVLLDDGGEVVVSHSVIFNENGAAPAPAPGAPALELQEDEEEPQLGGEEPNGNSDGGAPSGGGGSGDDATDSAQRTAGDPARAPGDAPEPGGATARVSDGRAQRERRQPRALDGYVVGAAATGATADPLTYSEAMNRPDAARWRDAMAKEVVNMESNAAWELGTPPPGAHPISAKTVFKIKVDPYGAIIKYKARLVARGFMEGWVGDVFAPASLITTVRTFFAVAAARDLELGSLDVDGAFLKGELPPGTWIELPAYAREYMSAAPPGSGPVYVHLKKAMYGLKIAPKVWYETLFAALKRHGFARAAADPCLFTATAPDGEHVYLVAYVDDCVVASKSKAGVKFGVNAVLSEFAGRDQGEPTAFLGMKIERARAQRLIMLSQERHLRDLLTRFHMEGCRPKATPLAAGRVLAAAGEALDTSAYPYTSLLGGLLYLATHTRPDLAHGTSVLARYSQRPTNNHWRALLDVLRYAAGTAGLRLHLGGGGELVGWCDADWAGDIDTRRSTTGFIFKLGDGAIAWSSKRQGIVTVSTAESEYTAACAAAREASWLRQLAAALDVRVDIVPLMSDSQAAIAMTKNLSVSARTKHMDVRLHFLRERVARGDISLSYTSTVDMLADPLTKPVPAIKFVAMREAWGLK